MKKKHFFLEIYWTPCFYNTFSRLYSLQLENSTYPWVKGKLPRKTTGVFLKENYKAPSFLAHSKHHFTCLSAWSCLPFLEILLLVVRGALSPQKSIKLIHYILASKQFFFRGFLSCCSYLIRNNTLFLQILLICMSIIYFKMISYFGDIKWWKNTYLRIDSIKYLSLYSFPFLFILL